MGSRTLATGRCCACRSPLTTCIRRGVAQVAELERRDHRCLGPLPRCGEELADGASLRRPVALHAGLELGQLLLDCLDSRHLLASRSPFHARRYHGERYCVAAGEVQQGQPCRMNHNGLQGVERKKSALEHVAALGHKECCTTTAGCLPVAAASFALVCFPGNRILVAVGAWLTFSSSVWGHLLSLALFGRHLAARFLPTWPLGYILSHGACPFRRVIQTPEAPGGLLQARAFVPASS